MKIYNSKFSRWLFSTPYRAIHRAYEAGKKVRNFQRDYFFYKNEVGISSKRSFYNFNLYIDSILNQSMSTIFWSLIEFQISIKFCNFLMSYIVHPIFNIFNNESQASVENGVVKDLIQNFKLIGQEHKNPLNIYTRSLKQKINSFISVFSFTNKRIGLYTENISFTSSIQKNCFFLNKFYKKKLDWERWNRKLTWIETVLLDLEGLKNTGLFYSEILSDQKNQKYSPALNIFSNISVRSYYEPDWSQQAMLSIDTLFKKILRFLNFYPSSTLSSKVARSMKGTERGKDTAYESLGLVPRSITRTLSRFQTELEGRSASLVLPEFRLAKYQAITSLKYLFFLILIPLFFLVVCKIIFLEPLLENWWNTAQFQIFLSISQEEKALKRLQQVEELLWLDIIMADSSAKQPQDLSAQIHKRTIDLVESYNQESIQTILHFFSNFIFVFVVILLLILGKKKLAILNSWVQVVFYSLSVLIEIILFEKSLLILPHFLNAYLTQGLNIRMSEGLKQACQTNGPIKCL